MTVDSYNATVVTGHQGEASDDLVDALMDGLADYHCAVSGLDGRVAVTISLPAEGLRQAISTALAVVETVLAQAAPAALPVRSVEVLPTEDFDRRWGFDPMPDLLSVTQAAEVMGVSDARVRQLLDAGQLTGTKAGATWVVSRRAAEARAAARSQPVAKPEVVTYR